MLKTIKDKYNFFKNVEHNKESGNVLFLILIAVALFAALSYAVTQSSRSGGGDANSETNLISSAEVTQYPAAVRTSILRMVISDNVDVTALNFDPPSAFATTCTATPGNCVFHPEGGGATYTTSSPDVTLGGTSPGTWYFSGNYEVVNIGTSDGSTSFDGNDIIAFLPDIKSSICSKVNEELGISGSTTHADDLDVTAAAQQMDSGYDPDTAAGSTITIGAATGDADLSGRPFGCMTDSAGEFIYYHVLVER